MDLKRIQKTVARFFAWQSLVISSLIIEIIPMFLLYPFANILAKIAFLLIVRHRRVALDGLTIAFGKEKSRDEIKRIAKECFNSLAKSVVELLYFYDKPHLVKKRVILEERAVLDLALSKGKGVILVSGHFGNFPLLMLRLKIEGYAIGGIMRPMRDKRVERIFEKRRRISGIKTIGAYPREVCIKETLQALRNNEIIFIPIDQNFGKGGVFVDFFNRQAATATGPIIFALRTGAAVIPCFIIRENHNMQRVVFEQEFGIQKEKVFSQTLQRNIQGLTNIIEFYIRRYPSQWGWMHKRWKSQPKT
ncbi:MAG: lysophospholipid acyltransferase family protein [Candidatus Omnitrophica bacterium]|nr:lysophospholipid acyltransferase family protein [Candidatus Omnitrophota bacterium]